jgi:lactoylglutathione lyase
MPTATVTGLFETHLTVRDLEASIRFYQEVVGLELAYRMDERGVAFLWIGGPGEGMLGLSSAGSSPNVMRLHLAFTTSIDDVLAAPVRLKAAGVTPRGFRGEPSDEPIVLCWMPAVSIYFQDPDGHLLEYLAMLPDAPRPDLTVVTYSEWQRLA